MGTYGRKMPDCLRNSVACVLMLAELAPLREENFRLTAEIRAILQSRLSSSEEAFEKRAPWGASDKLSRSLSARRHLRFDATNSSQADVGSRAPPGKSSMHGLQRDALSDSSRSLASSPSMPNVPVNDHVDVQLVHQQQQKHMPSVNHTAGAAMYMEPAEFQAALKSLSDEPLRPPELRVARQRLM